MCLTRSSPQPLGRPLREEHWSWLYLRHHGLLAVETTTIAQRQQLQQRPLRGLCAIPTSSALELQLERPAGPEGSWMLGGPLWRFEAVRVVLLLLLFWLPRLFDQPQLFSGLCDWSSPSQHYSWGRSLPPPSSPPLGVVASPSSLLFARQLLSLTRQCLAVVIAAVSGARYIP